LAEFFGHNSTIIKYLNKLSFDIIRNMVKNQQIIRKVWKNVKNNQLLITIPKEQGIKDGDYVVVKKVNVDAL
jgi:hypothetical protein